MGTTYLIAGKNVCKNTFCEVNGISKSRLQRIRKTVSSGKFNANEHDNQGKRPRSTSTSYRHESLAARIRTTREILDLIIVSTIPITRPKPKPMDWNSRDQQIAVSSSMLKPCSYHLCPHRSRRHMMDGFTGTVFEN